VRPRLVIDPPQHDVVSEPGGEQKQQVLLDLECRVIRRTDIREEGPDDLVENCEDSKKQKHAPAGAYSAFLRVEDAAQVQVIGRDVRVEEIAAATTTFPRSARTNGTV